MPFSIRPYRRFLVQRFVTYNPGPVLKLPLAYCSGKSYTEPSSASLSNEPCLFLDRHPWCTHPRIECRDNQ